MIGDLQAVLENFLVALEDPEAGGTVYDAYARQAPLFLHGRSVPRLAVERDDFAFMYGLGWRMPPTGDGAPRLPSVTGLLPLQAALEGLQAVAWFGATERHTGQALCLGVGFVNEQGAWRIGWLTLARTPQPWDYATGLFQTVGDLPFGEIAGWLAPRSWLDVAYLRLYGRDEPALLTLPEARFGCHGSSLCCDIGFETNLAPSNQAIIDLLPWEHVAPALAGTQLPVKPDGKLLLKARDERCRFLDENKHCLVHKAAGRQLFPVCAIYPFVFADTPDGVAVTTAATCPSARDNLGPALTSRTDDLYQRLALIAIEKPPSSYFLAPGHEVDWATFQATEQALLGWLARTDLPLARRLWLATCELEARLAGVPFDAPAAESRPLPAGDRHQSQAARAFLRDFNGVMDLPPGTEGDPFRAGAALDREAELTSLMRNLLFGKVFSFRCDLLSAHHVNVFLLVWAIHVQSQMPDGRMPERLFWRLSGTAAHGGLKRMLTADDEASQEFQRAVKSRSFGAWLLAVLVPAP